MKKAFIFLGLSVLLFSNSAVAQNLPSYLPSNGLVGWWPFNGNANDESGNGNDGTVLSGTVLSTDRYNQSNSSYEVDGLNCPNAKGVSIPASLINSEYTVSIWSKSNDSTKVSQCMINSYPHGFIGLNLNYGLSVCLNKICSFYGNGNWIDGGDQILWDSFKKESWKHFIITKKLNSIEYYENGNLKYVQSISQLASPGTISSFVCDAISINGGGGCYETFKGKIDDVAIYNRALTQEEITALYTGTPVNGGGGSASANPVPPGIPYQAVVRNANGQVAANAAVTTRFTLHQNTADGAVEFQETHALTTNAQGLMATVLGQGTAVQNTFATINWANTTKFLQVEVDLGNGYVDLGTQQLMSVPYAMYAANGPAGPQGPAGPAGADGADGTDGATGPTGPSGVGISNVVIQNNHLMVTLSDGSVQDAGAVLSEGCTNDLACNYNSSALIDNGNCLIIGQACDDNDPATTYSIVDNSCQCISNSDISNSGALLLPENSICTNEYISVAGCEGDTALVYFDVVYDLVEINGQCWFKENLATTKFRDGSNIPQVTDNGTWYNMQGPAFCWYNNNPSYAAERGAMYNWWVGTTGLLCPSGWHVPTDCDWMYLENSIGMPTVLQTSTGWRAGGYAAALKDTSWNSGTVSGTNVSGFTGKPGGFRYWGGPFTALDGFSRWWSINQFDAQQGQHRNLWSDNNDIGRGGDYKQMGFSVRCVKNGANYQD